MICGAPLRFDASTGEGATVEHITARSLGGTNDLFNLGITHGRCNHEKGRHWDPKQRHRASRDHQARYDEIVTRLHAERLRRWREPLSGDANDSEDANGALARRHAYE